MNPTVFNNFSFGSTEVLWTLLLGDNVTDFSNSFTKIDDCYTFYCSAKTEQKSRSDVSLNIFIES